MEVSFDALFEKKMSFDSCKLITFEMEGRL